MAAAAIAIGVLWALDRAFFDSIPPSAYPATALGVIAAALLLGTWYGRSRLLIAAGILTTLVTAVTAVAGSGPYGERIYRPLTSADVHSAYHLGVGNLVVHLEQISDPRQLAGQSVDINAHIGHVEVIVPSTIPVTISAHVDHGEIDGPRRSTITGLDEGGEETTMSSVPDGGTAALVLNLDLDFGQITVTQYDCASASARSTGLITDQRAGGTDAAPACP
jgi:hypothetical protein